MTRAELLDYCFRTYGTEADYPWSDGNAVLRHRGSGKWYAVILEVRREKLGLPGEGSVHVVNVKCDPVLSGSLRTQPGYFPAYHMNKEQWLSILLDAAQPETEIQSLIDLSFRMTDTKK